jgi:hypothetical protein
MFRAAQGAQRWPPGDDAVDFNQSFTVSRQA